MLDPTIDTLDAHSISGKDIAGVIVVALKHAEKFSKSHPIILTVPVTADQSIEDMYQSVLTKTEALKDALVELYGESTISMDIQYYLHVERAVSSAAEE